MSKKKRNVDEAFDPDYDYVYGMTEYRISLTEDVLKDDTELRKSVTRILEVIVGLLKDRAVDELSYAQEKRKADEVFEEYEYVYGIVTIGRRTQELNRITQEREEDFRGYSGELNTKLLVEIAEPRKKFAEIEGENAEIPELRKNRVEELEQKNTKLEARFAILEKGSLVADCQLHKEAMPKRFREQTTSHVDLSSSVIDQRNNDDVKASEEKEMDAFLVEVNKKSISDKIREEAKKEGSGQDDSQKLIPQQVIKESISAHKKPPVKEPSAVILPVKSYLVDKQTASGSAPDSYDADMVCQKFLTIKKSKVEQAVTFNVTNHNQ
ncbi:hypothetical protein C1646_763896 [Rhizophagus diaphanus]|nr:hypothetical protein C1646_763896 [Rhizophagus diaphanus] [Rhizophagus sp. MUCL 43196]